ncbi:MAG TPA: AAA family ATPase, partial [Acidimicrobiales bacterium]|nr:AAA family ATPase [Acidimicrobiales bacterium]
MPNAALSTAAPADRDPDRDGRRARPVASVAPLVGRTALVGRRDELEALDRAWERACTGRGTTAVVTGPPGVGKTTLVAELARRRDAAGDLVLRAHCTTDPGAPDHWPWIQIVRHCAGLFPTRLLAEWLGTRAQHLVRAVPELASSLAAEGLAPTLDTAGARFAFCDATLSLLHAVAGDRPVAVVIDDVHWADADSLRLLDLLCRSAHDAAVLVVVTHRDVEPCVDLDAAGLLAGVAGHGARLPLAGFSEAETALMMAGRAGDEPAAALVHEVHALTGGNPLFVDEAIRLLATGMTLSSLDRVPASLLATTARALDTLGDDELALLRTAAIVGREFGEGVLGVVLRESPARLHARLLAAGRRGFIRAAATGADTWTFADPAVHEALLGRLDAREAAELHRRVADALRSGVAPGAARPAEIAEHVVAAARLGPVGPAVECCRAAAAEAKERRAHRDAVRWLEEAVRLAYRDTAATDDERFELLLALGQTQGRAGLTRSAADTFERARRVADRRGDAAAMARAVLGAVDTRQRGPAWDATLDDVPALLERTSAELAAHSGGHAALAARLLASRASIHALAFEPGTARACAEECAALARTSDDLEVHHAAVVAARWAAMGPAPLSVKTELTDQLVLHTAQTGDQAEAWRAQRWRLGDGLEAGDPDAVNRAVSMAMGLAEELAEPDLLFHTYMLQATVALLEGRFDDVRELHRRARQLGPSWEVPEEVILAHELYLGWELGQVDLALVRAVTEVFPRPVARALECWTAMIGDDRDVARHEVERFFDEVVLGDVPDGHLLPAILAMIAEAVARTGLVQYAGPVRDRLAPLADQCVVAGPKVRVWGGSNHLYLGMLSTILGDHDAAERHLDAAERVHRRMGARCHLVRGQLWRARL